jgi:hypothetical protein
MPQALLRAKGFCRAFSMRFAVALAALAILVPAGASAQSREEQEQAIEKTLECRTIEDDAERLACLDRGAEELSKTRFFFESEAAEAKPQMETEEQFGSESVPEERKKRDETKLKRIASKIAEIRVRTNNRATFTLENGQVWRQLDSDDHVLHFYDKDRLYEATIKRSLFNNYMMKISGMGKAIRVERVK